MQNELRHAFDHTAIASGHFLYTNFSGLPIRFFFNGAFSERKYLCLRCARPN